MAIENEILSKDWNGRLRGWIQQNLKTLLTDVLEEMENQSKQRIDEMSLSAGEGFITVKARLKDGTEKSSSLGLEDIGAAMLNEATGKIGYDVLPGFVLRNLRGASSSPGWCYDPERRTLNYTCTTDTEATYFCTPSSHVVYYDIETSQFYRWAGNSMVAAIDQSNAPDLTVKADLETDRNGRKRLAVYQSPSLAVYFSTVTVDGVMHPALGEVYYDTNAKELATRLMSGRESYGRPLEGVVYLSAGEDGKPYLWDDASESFYPLPNHLAAWANAATKPAYNISEITGGLTAQQIQSMITEAINDVGTIQGAPGKSAYDIAVEQGFEGSEAEWLASLKGATGATGSSGFSGAAEDLEVIPNLKSDSDIAALAASQGKPLHTYIRRLEAALYTLLGALSNGAFWGERPDVATDVDPDAVTYPVNIRYDEGVTYSQEGVVNNKVTEGERYRLTVTAKDGYTLSSVYFKHDGVVVPVTIEDGSAEVEIAEVSGPIDAILSSIAMERYNVTGDRLVGCRLSGPTSVIAGSAYDGVLDPLQNYSMSGGHVQILMAGEGGVERDITGDSGVYTGGTNGTGVIHIAQVTGDIRIIATAVEVRTFEVRKHLLNCTATGGDRVEYGNGYSCMIGLGATGTNTPAVLNGDLRVLMDGEDVTEGHVSGTTVTFDAGEVTGDLDIIATASYGKIRAIVSNEVRFVIKHKDKGGSTVTTSYVDVVPASMLQSALQVSPVTQPRPVSGSNIPTMDNGDMGLSYQFNDAAAAGSSARLGAANQWVDLDIDLSGKEIVDIGVCADGTNTVEAATTTTVKSRVVALDFCGLVFTGFVPSQSCQQFYNMRNLEYVLGLVVSPEEGNGVPTFRQCTKLAGIDTLGWDLSRVTTVNSLFYMCSSLTGIDVTGWSLKNCTNLVALFSKCTSLSSITGLNSLDVSKVTTMNSAFAGIAVDTLDISRWSTPRLSNIQSFAWSSGHIGTLIIGDFITSNVPGDETYYKYALYGTTRLVCTSATPPAIGAGNMLGTLPPSSAVIYVPDDSVDAYRTAAGWKDYSGKISPVSEMS